MITSGHGNGGGEVVKFLICGARGPGFEPRPRHFDFRDWVSCASFAICLDLNNCLSEVKIFKSTKPNLQVDIKSIYCFS